MASSGTLAARRRDLAALGAPRRALAGPSGHWDDIPGEADPEHSAPFDLEVPRLLIKLISYLDELVVDLVLGRGTTALVCIEVGRRFHGGDHSATCVAIAEDRVASAVERERAA